MSGAAPITVVETPEFLSATRKLLTEEERAVLVDYLAHNPTAGELITGTGGVRKLRWKVPGRGKRGGARIIYYFRDLNMPLYLIAVYKKTEKDTASIAVSRQAGVSGWCSILYWISAACRRLMGYIS